MSSSTRIERDAAAWLARRDAGWSQADQAQLDAWLQADVAHRVAYIRLNAAWQQADRLKALGAGVPAGQVPARGEWTLSPFFNGGVSSEKATSSNASQVSRAASHGRARKRRRGPAWMKIAAVAACFALVAVLGFGWLRYSAVQSAEYATPLSATESIALSDGSRTTLSSDSRVRTTMSRHERHIDLQRGEAYFEVAHDAARPFVVAAGERRVVAVGTRFSVRRENDGIRVVVTEGVVRLVSSAGAPAQSDLRLPAGSVAFSGKDGVSVESLGVERAEEYLSWRNGFVRFRGTPLSEAVAEFNRYNSRKIVVADARAAAVRIGGQFRWSNTDAFVRLLKDGFSIRAEQQGDKIVLHGE
jgi:transmembrane sensor